MLWSVDSADFFEEYFHNSEATLSALLCAAIRPCVDLTRKHLNEDEVTREGGAILRYHFRVRREFGCALASLSAVIVVIVMLLGGARLESSEGNGPRRAEHRESYLHLTEEFDIRF
jgi:hypothetical protein